jgi:spermidine synthase
VWSNDVEGQGYDVVLLGQIEPLHIDVDQLEARLVRRDHQAVAASLEEVGFRSTIDFVATFAGSAADLKPWLADAQINRDRNLRLQYLAGMSAHDYQETRIYNQMIKDRKFPKEIFIASAETLAELRRRFQIHP